MRHIIRNTFASLIIANLLTLILGWWLYLNVVAIILALLLFWWDAFITAIKQFKLNRSMLVLMENLGLQLLEHSIFLPKDYNRVITEAKKHLSSKAVLLLYFLYPWKYLKYNIMVARKLIWPFEFQLLLSLTPEQKTLLAEIHDSEIKLLPYRVIGYPKLCHHIEMQTDAFICLESNAVFNEIKSLFWCKYCLVSFWEIRQVPVIVKPP